ncbi:MAG: hypothetical protein EXQ98_04855 [Alphaproteobacteria bacterium]|nr:hypothetical protein [Alphaproteobacteria bacterium]
MLRSLLMVALCLMTLAVATGCVVVPDGRGRRHDDGVYFNFWPDYGHHDRRDWRDGHGRRQRHHNHH